MITLTDMLAEHSNYIVVVFYKQQQLGICKLCYDKLTAILYTQMLF